MRWLVVLFLPLVQAGLDTTVCTPPPTPSTAQPMRPVIPSSFEVHVDCIIVNKNMTTEVHEHYDDIHNRGVAEQHEYGESYKAYYDYNHNEFMGIFPNTGICSVSNLSTSDQRFLFGYSKTNGGKGHIYTPSGALHFGANVTELYQGLTQVRGIWCQSWQSCQYWAGMKASMNVTWYFADPNSWDTALGVPQIPVRCYVNGRVQETAAKSHDFEHYYEFIHFRDYIEDPKVFEMDDNVVCPGRINTKPLPNVADVLTVLVEQVDEIQKTVSFTSEWFDSRMKLTRFDMRPTALSASKFGTNRLDIVRDFGSGIMYVKDQLRGNCTVAPLSQDNWDDRMQDAQHVRIATAQEFFHFKNKTYSYTGIKTVRGVDCDTWISRMTDFPPGFPTNSTWEWAFVSQNWTSGYDQISTAQSAIPFRLNIHDDALGIDYTMNLFEYNGKEPNVMDFDVTNCMATEQRRTFKMAFPQKNTQVISQNIQKFRYACLIAITTAASVSPLRAANLRVNIFNNTAHLNFDLTDVPPVHGDVMDDNIGLPLPLVASLLVKAVKGGQFPINFIVNNTMVYVNPVTTSLVQMIAGPTSPRSTTTTTTTSTSTTTQKPTTPTPSTTKPTTPTPSTTKLTTTPTPVPPTQKPHTPQTQKQPQTQNAPQTQKPPKGSTSTPTKGPTPPTHTIPHFTLKTKTSTTWNPFAMVSSMNQLCGSASGGGYSAGVMAGVAVVMVVLGGVGGGGLAIFLARRRRI